MEIFDTNDSFDFNNLMLTTPTLISGGNYFIRFLVNKNPLYIQPPKCKTKQGFTKVNKRYSCDLMFTNENENFIRWMENLESYCQQFIYKNREKWFDGNMELHDIENYFTSTLKIYKSGKYYIVRVNANINAILNKPSLKIYDENENEVDIETICENTNVLTIVEIQGIKCSSRSFQIELDLKQMMVVQQNNLFEKCIIKTNHPTPVTKESYVSEVSEPIIANQVLETQNEIDVVTPEMITETEIIIETPVEVVEHVALEEKETLIESEENKSKDDNEPYLPEGVDTEEMPMYDGMEEIDFPLEELKDKEPMQLKKRNDVYYEMYREARRKAKIARDLALSSYLEAKRIKNTYMLDDIEESDDSDLEIDEENSLDE
jgi:hypothetical protein